VRLELAGRRRQRAIADLGAVEAQLGEAQAVDVRASARDRLVQP
jgi:hypothetical protein